MMPYWFILVNMVTFRHIYLLPHFQKPVILSKYANKLIRRNSPSVIQPLLIRSSTLPAPLFWLCRWEIKLGHIVCFHLFPRKDIFVPAL